MKKTAALLIAAALLAAACGSDDAESNSLTTVPTTSLGAATTTTVAADQPQPEDEEQTEDQGQAEDQGQDAASVDEPPTTTAAATLPAGDITQASIELEEVGRFNRPIDAVVAPNGEWWLAERPGEVIVVDPDTGVAGDTILDIADETEPSGERGLLGLAVDSEALYVNYTDLDGTTQVDAFVLDGDGRPGERVPLLTIEQPFANHNGGALAIGPDGHLYIAVGDGGGADDPLNAGQDPDQILGSIVRIDPTPTGPQPYLIPADNPYADGGGVPEIFLIGVRNPWRMAFDPITGDFWIADVGQGDWEEITLLLGANGWGVGTNLGWNLREGVAEFRGERPPNNVDPVFVYAHTGAPPSGCSITGGEVYRGSAIPELHGAYLFGDFCRSQLWAVSVSTGEVVFKDLNMPMPGRDLVDFATLPDGEIVAISLGGQVVRIVPA